MAPPHLDPSARGAAPQPRGKGPLVPPELPALANALAKPPAGRALRSALRELYDTGLETEKGLVIARARVRAIQEDVFRTLRARGLEPRLLLSDGTNEFVHH